MCDRRAVLAFAIEQSAPHSTWAPATLQGAPAKCDAPTPQTAQRGNGRIAGCHVVPVTTRRSSEAAQAPALHGAPALCAGRSNASSTRRRRAALSDDHHRPCCRAVALEVCAWLLSEAGWQIGTAPHRLCDGRACAQLEPHGNSNLTRRMYVGRAVYARLQRAWAPRRRPPGCTRECPIECPRIVRPGTPRSPGRPLGRARPDAWPDGRTGRYSPARPALTTMPRPCALHAGAAAPARHHIHTSALPALSAPSLRRCRHSMPSAPSARCTGPGGDVRAVCVCWRRAAARGS